MISEGPNINVTLIFGLPRYAQVTEAYMTGLERFAEDPGADLSRVASVASYFISRVDVEVDKRLEMIGTDEALRLRGKAAIAQGTLAYRQFTETFAGSDGGDSRPGASEHPGPQATEASQQVQPIRPVRAQPPASPRFSAPC